MMTKNELYKALDCVNVTGKQRLKHAQLILNNPELMPFVMDILFETNNKISDHSAWILEYAVRENLNVIFPHIERFTSNMYKVNRDSSVRAVAKICEYLIEAYFSIQSNEIKTYLKTHHKERIIEVTFDYLISDKKIATQVYSMNTLFY
jgi:hypothetical protein